MAAREPVTTLAAIATTYRSNDQKRREVDALLGNPLWSHLTDAVVADVAGVSLRMVRRRRRLQAGTAVLEALCQRAAASQGV
jgi:hypothetical protein